MSDSESQTDPEAADVIEKKDQSQSKDDVKNQEESKEIKTEAENDLQSFLNKDYAAPEKQEARAFLRERFLRVVTGIIGKNAQFHLYENTSVSAEFRGCDIDFHELFVRKLTTPLGTIPEAILRTNDVIFLEINDV